MPKFLIERDDLRGVIRFHGEFPTSALASLRLDPLDRTLLLDAHTGKTAADHLLVLEMLFRRYAESVRLSKPTASTDAPAPAASPASPDAPRG